MKKTIIISALLATSVMSGFAQLKVNASGKVGIKTGNTNLNARLTVGNNTTNTSSSVGIASSPYVQNMTNIGVEGTVSANSAYTSDKNYGVLGIISSMNLSHGRNYGVSGMIGPLGNHYGGAGVYGTNSTYYYNYPTNIQGEYAGYFEGPVHMTQYLTTLGMYTSSDSRLCVNIESLDGRNANGKGTLDKVLNMTVVEYNLKSRLSDDIPDDVDPEKAEEISKSYQVLKKDEEELASRRHFGVDAQELQKLYPDLVMEGQDGYLSVNYAEMVPILIRSIRMLKQELDELKGVQEQ